MDSNTSNSLSQFPDFYATSSVNLIERVQKVIDNTANHTCIHTVPLPLENKCMPDRTACPSCLVKYHTAVVETVQLGIEYRGGVFASRDRILPDDFSMGHQDWMKLWHAVKLESSQDIGILEEVQNKFPEQAKEWGIPQALENWEKVQDAIGRVPGYSYIEEGVDESVSVDPNTPSSLSSKNVEDVIDRIESVDLYDPVTGVDSDAAPKPEDDNALVTSSAKQSDNKGTLKSPNISAILPGRSALKGSRPTTLPSTRATFSEQPTIISRGTLLSNPAIAASHNKHTAAETARSSNSFHRSSSHYEAAIWASPDGFEKEDTSFSGETWDRYDILARMSAWNDKATALAAKKLGTRAKSESKSDPAMADALADAITESRRCEQDVSSKSKQKAFGNCENKELKSDVMQFVEQSER
jgi:hypothetical protein